MLNLIVYLIKCDLLNKWTQSNEAQMVCFRMVSANATAAQMRTGHQDTRPCPTVVAGVRREGKSRGERDSPRTREPSTDLIIRYPTVIRNVSRCNYGM